MIEINNDKEWCQVKTEADFLNQIFAFLNQEANVAAMVIQKDKHNIGAQNVLTVTQKDIEMMTPLIATQRIALYKYLTKKHESLLPLKNPNLNLTPPKI